MDRLGRPAEASVRAGRAGLRLRGRRRVLAVIKDGEASEPAASGSRERVARKILEHLGLPAQAPAVARAVVPQGDLWPTGPPSDDLFQVPAPDEFDQRLAELDEE
jgi:hypothetical protein